MLRMWNLHLFIYNGLKHFLVNAAGLEMCKKTTHTVRTLPGQTKFIKAKSMHSFLSNKSIPVIQNLIGFLFSFDYESVYVYENLVLFLLDSLKGCCSIVAWFSK